ncbi:DUF3768 domain-containing protein [Notoacmeibacter ruber]|nr:DUF3768 domain-containing protein [Notoacmeibacter ruber]
MAQYICLSCGSTETLDSMIPDCCSACGGSLVNVSRATAIAEKNDAFRRQSLTASNESAPIGRVVMTRAVAFESEAFQLAAMQAVAAQTAFEDDNDPYGEHDFGKVTALGKDLFWKIDLYDADYQYGTEDALDDAQTRRLLTIMFPEDY